MPSSRVRVPESSTVPDVLGRASPARPMAERFVKQPENRRAFLRPAQGQRAIIV